ncbi:MAG: hypothetical protein KGZ30_02055 [Anaplasmataceae bacterium]|nr:hypothetical protein [Anaplasmataceae bacterium]
MKKVLVGALIASVATFGVASSALAFDGIFVKNNNGASVTNQVMVSASTGGNDANGGYAGNGGAGGSVNSSDSENVGGNGGAAGDGGMGGGVQTGDAVAAAEIANVVNSNDVEVDACGCNVDLIKVRNNNGASLANQLYVKAKTGYNNADGGNAGSAGDAGSVNSSNDQNTSGNGGNSGNGGAGGVVITGVAQSISAIANVINSNIVRIR